MHSSRQLMNEVMSHGSFARQASGVMSFRWAASLGDPSATLLPLRCFDAIGGFESWLWRYGTAGCDLHPASSNSSSTQRSDRQKWFNRRTSCEICSDRVRRSQGSSHMEGVQSMKTTSTMFIEHQTAGRQDIASLGSVGYAMLVPGVCTTCFGSTCCSSCCGAANTK